MLSKLSQFISAEVLVVDSPAKRITVKVFIDMNFAFLDPIHLDVGQVKVAVALILLKVYFPCGEITTKTNLGCSRVLIYKMRLGTVPFSLSLHFLLVDTSSSCFVITFLVLCCNFSSRTRSCGVSKPYMLSAYM